MTKKKLGKMRKTYIASWVNPKEVESVLREHGYDAMAYTGGVLEKGKLPFWTNAPQSFLNRLIAHR